MRRSDSAMARKVADEMVILDVASGHYFGLNDVGAVIWERMDAECTREDLIDVVVASFDVDRQRAGADIDDLLTDLADRGLVTL